MPVIPYDRITGHAVEAEGVKGVTKANVVGEREGWEHHTLRVFRVEPGGYTPQHQHDWEHVNYVIKGKGKLLLNGETRALQEKDFAFVPPNTPHQFKNESDELFEFICIVPNRGAY
jgi:quercetin dioxygenase-like cupin family protein